MAVRRSKFEPSFNAGVLIVDGTLILSVSRQPYEWHKNSYDWGLPGGHAEPFENPYDTAKRELTEETGLQVHQLAPVLTVPPEYAGGRPFHVYRPTTIVWGQIKQHTREGVVRWMSPDRFVRVHNADVSVAESNRYILYWALGWQV